MYEYVCVRLRVNVKGMCDHIYRYFIEHTERIIVAECTKTLPLLSLPVY